MKKIMIFNSDSLKNKEVIKYVDFVGRIKELEKKESKFKENLQELAIVYKEDDSKLSIINYICDMWENN